MMPLSFGFSFKNDSIKIDKEEGECVLKFENIALISHNDLLN